MDRLCHKNFYTTRSPGYKYRTSSTNTGNGTKMDSVMAANLVKKFADLSQAITAKITNEAEKTRMARESIKEKIEMVNSKINSVLNLQATVATLRKDLLLAENSIATLLEKIEKIESIEDITYVPFKESYCLSPRKNSLWEEP